MLEHITPVILTFNEAPNITRTLSHLGWARDIVVVDSGSDDGTLEQLARWSNVRVFSRRFDTHAKQWLYATSGIEISTPWILRLDADYQLTDDLIEELRVLDPDAPVDGYSISFDYAIFSQKLHASLYPEKTILLRLGRFIIGDAGHTESWAVAGTVKRLRSRIVHDDWKSTPQFIDAQSQYMSKELARLSAKSVRFQDRLRLIPPLMPIAVFVYCLFGKGLILNGRAGIFYALQRAIAEAILSLMVLEREMSNRCRYDEPRKMPPSSV